MEERQRQREEERILQLKATQPGAPGLSFENRWRVSGWCTVPLGIGWPKIAHIWTSLGHIWLLEVEYGTHLETLNRMTMSALRPCRFGRKCKKRDCPNAHLEGT